MKEVEILYSIDERLDTALEKLKAFDAKGLKETLDVYFIDPLRDDLKPDETGELKNCFRIRKKGGENYLTYKIDHFDDGAWSHSDEYETKVESFDRAVDIVTRLGLKELVRVHNKKHTFLTEEYEIVLEDVENLGLFLEVELLQEVSDEEVQDTKQRIRQFVEDLGFEVGEEQTAGKPELLLRKG